MSLYSPENAQHVMKPTMMKSFSTSGLINAQNQSANKTIDSTLSNGVIHHSSSANSAHTMDNSLVFSDPFTKNDPNIKAAESLNGHNTNGQVIIKPGLYHLIVFRKISI